MRKPNLTSMTRRVLLGRSSVGLGGFALSSLLNRDASAANSTSHPLPHLVARAKQVIFLHMVGAPSQLDLFDFKPELQKHDRQPCPNHLLEGQRFAFLRGHPSLLGTRFRFAKHGDSGIELSELLPHLSSVADEIAVVKSLQTELINHGPSQLFFHSGFGRFGRPSIGSWISYGLGSANHNLPTFVVMMTGALAGAGNALWGNGFLPSVHQGVEFRHKGNRCCFSRTRKASIPLAGDASSRPYSHLIRGSWLRSVIQKSRLASPSTNSHFGCRLPCPN